MKFAPCVLALGLAGTVAGCGAYYSEGYRYGYAPQYAYAPAPVYYTSSYSYDSKWDYYRNYNGSFHPGPEHYP
jgi:hypothetical protein